MNLTELANYITCAKKRIYQYMDKRFTCQHHLCEYTIFSILRVSSDKFSGFRRIISKENNVSEILGSHNQSLLLAPKEQSLGILLHILSSTRNAPQQYQPIQNVQKLKYHGLDHTATQKFNFITTQLQHSYLCISSCVRFFLISLDR